MGFHKSHMELDFSPLCLNAEDGDLPKDALMEPFPASLMRRVHVALQTAVIISRVPFYLRTTLFNGVNSKLVGNKEILLISIPANIQVFT